MRRLALISDIHGNALALEAVLADIARRVSTRSSASATSPRAGPQPREALERLRALGCAVVRGNADEWLLGLLPAGEDKEGGGACGRLSSGAPATKRRRCRLA